MFSNRKITTSTKDCSDKVRRLRELLQKADAVIIGAGAGLFQCSKPCHNATYDNEKAIRDMVEQQTDMKIPTELIPHCPVCGKPMTMNLRADDTFVQDKGWYQAGERYADFIRRHKGLQTLFLEIGVGMNTPGIVKFSFWRMTAESPKATYACVNLGEACAPMEIIDRSICINADIGEVLKQL